MASSKHLWSGDWQDESAAAARRRAANAETRAPGEQRPLPHPTAPPQRRWIAAWNGRRRTLAGAGLLAAAAAAAVTGAVVGRGHPAASNSSPPAVVRAPQNPQAAPGAGQNGSGSGQSAPGAGIGGSGASSAAGSAWLGANVLPSSSGGVLVNEIVAGGPADSASLQPDDFILAVDNRPVGSPRELIAAISAFSPGRTVAIRVRRGSATFTTEATLAARPSGYPAP